MTTASTRRRPGRPTALDVRIQLPDGSTTTVAERIVALLAGAVPLHTAAAAAGVNQETLRVWLNTGARIGQELAARKRTTAALTPLEKACWEFSARVATAEAGWVVDALCGIEEARRGGRKVVRTTERHDSQGAVVERTIVTEELAPNIAAAQWLLERRYPEEWGRRRLEVTGPDGGPVITSPADVAADMRAFLEERKAQREGGA